MSNHLETNGLHVAEELYSFVRDEALPGTGLDAGSSGTARPA